jgi:hypothetical protein
MPTRHASSPGITRSVSNGGRTACNVTSSSFSPPADSWIYVERTANASSVAPRTFTFGTPTNTGTALTWEKIGEVVSGNGGGVAVYRAYNASAQASITVSSTVTYNTQSGAIADTAHQNVAVWTGCKSSQTGAAFNTLNSTGTSNNPAVTTTAFGSRVAAGHGDWGAAAVPTSSDSTIAGDQIATTFTSSFAYKASDSGNPASVAINFSQSGSPDNSFFIYEILAAPALPTYNVGRPSLELLAQPALGGFAMLDVRAW